MGVNERTAVAIGKFDGVHLGHRRLISCLMDSRRDGLIPTILTFDPPPEQLFTGHVVPQLLTVQEKREVLESLGIELLVELPMTMETASMAPERFISEVLARGLHAGLVAAGPDLSFGYRGSGDFTLLDSLSGEYGYEARCIDKVVEGGAVVSSTRIRGELERGDIAAVNALMGEPYRITGRVTQDEEGLELITPPDKLLPGDGEYDAEVCRDEELVSVSLISLYKHNALC